MPRQVVLHTANLDVVTGSVGGISEPGCTISVPAIMACVPTVKANVTPTPPGGGGSGTPNSFFCYKVKCPPVAHLALNGSDQFGTRTVEGKSGSKLLCAPLVGPSTTTTSTSTTTTTLRFVDNGDGTVTDRQTGLQWEKKTGTPGPNVYCGIVCGGAECDDPHDTINVYSWSQSGGWTPDGCVFTDFLARLNDCASADGVSVSGGFAGHCDWRLPTIAELQTILVHPYPCDVNPCIDPIFGPQDAGNPLWSSTLSSPNGAPSVWIMFLENGQPAESADQNHYHVRAVRGGS